MTINLHRLALRHRDVKAVERHRDQTVEPDQINQFRGAVRAERLHGRAVAQFGQRAMVQERSGDVIGDRLLGRQIDRALAGDDSGELVVDNPRRSPAMTWA
jgi:hypothetical protein